jgi:hypothetical protein
MQRANIDKLVFYVFRKVDDDFTKCMRFEEFYFQDLSPLASTCSQGTEAGTRYFESNEDERWRVDRSGGKFVIGA